MILLTEDLNYLASVRSLFVPEAQRWGNALDASQWFEQRILSATRTGSVG